jgi:DNA-binding CsgD family transcriptional regulator
VCRRTVGRGPKSVVSGYQAWGTVHTGSEGSELSVRETQVLAIVARGMSNREAAGVLRLSEATIKRHLANVYARIGVHSRSKAVAKGLAEGWIILEEIASAGAPATAGGKRYRCVVEGCGCEVIVLRHSRDASSWSPPSCHGRTMVSSQEEWITLQEPTDDPNGAEGGTEGGGG